MEHNKSIPFSVLKTDYENSSKNFIDTQNCPAATAFKRQFPDFTWTSGGVTIFNGELGNKLFNFILTPGFAKQNFSDLEKGIEFHGSIELVNVDEFSEEL